MSTPLSLSWREALSEGNIEAVGYWLAQGVDPNAPVEGLGISPIAMAASAGIPAQISGLLIAAGARMEGPPHHPLIVCAHTGNAPVARLLLSHGAQANQVDESGQWALDISVESGHLEVAKALLSHGALIDKPDKHGATVVMKAVRDKRLDMTQMLLDCGANPNCQDKRGAFALSIACTSFGDPQEEAIVMTLLDKTRRDLCNDLGCNVLQLCVAASLPNAVKKLLSEGEPVSHSNKRGISILHMAASRENPDILQMVLQAGGNVRDLSLKGETPLITATRLGHLDNINLLLDAKSDINAADGQGTTPLHIAAEQALDDVFHALVARGASLTATSENGSILHHAAIGGSEHLIQWLTRKHILDNALNSQGRSALHLAAENNCPEAAMALIQAGSDIHRTTSDGFDIFQMGGEEFNAKITVFLADRQSRQLHKNTPSAVGGRSGRRI